VRTGDTSAKGRRDAIKRPPHVLVTTPESLFILLTSESGRRGLSTVRTVIVDEIHAVAADKRGAHLALSLERLDALVRGAGGTAPQRVGLSATVRPIDVAAKLLVGSRRPPPEIVDVGLRRDLDLAVEVPRDELGAATTNEQWDELYDRIAELARAHRSTLVFVNTRRLVERVAHQLGKRLGEELVAAHHGSMSRARRFDAEQRLKEGSLRLVVATASLELGIDVGAVELSCLIGSPRAIGTAMQRIGRSGHALGATPRGRFFPLTRDQLVECAAIVRGARRGELDCIALRDAPLDVLAQQIVATCACEEVGEDQLFEMVSSAAQYADLSRHDFDRVVSMLSDGIAARRGRAGALVYRDAINGRLKGRRSARIAAMTSGGAIPDTADYDVVLHEDGTRVGTVNEDWAIESMAGDVFLLGNTSWRIRRVAGGKVYVDDARGVAPTVPFWLGEAPARTRELSAEVSALRLEVIARMSDGAEAVVEWLGETCALDRRGAELCRDYLAAGRAALGEVPSQRTVVAERFFDEAGGMQLVLHAPFGGRINRAWGLALRKRFCRTFDFELQAAATDDGVLLSLGPQHSFPLETVFEMLDPEGIEELLVQAALQAPMFQTRWRWNLTRSLTLLRFRGGRKVPAPLQRMRADDLLAAVFPEQTQCQDNHGGMLGGPQAIEPPDHPLVFETIRDCLVEVMDVEGLRGVLRGLASGEIRRVARETPEPSVLSHEILNANPYAFLDDAPLEERRSRAVSVRRGLPAEIADRVGGLDPDAIARVVDEAQPDVRDADELSALLLDLCGVPEADGVRLGWEGHFAELLAAGRAARLRLQVGSHETRRTWVALERLGSAQALWPTASVEGDVRRWSQESIVDADEARTSALRAWIGITGPVTADELAARLGLDRGDVEVALARLELEGTVLRGRFTPALAEGQLQWCHRRLLARIHRLTVDRLRAEIDPVSPAQLIRFLLTWQCVRPAARVQGQDGLARVLAQLSGFEVAAGAWERDILPARVARYEPGWLDALCLSGEVVWGKLAPRAAAPMLVATEDGLAGGDARAGRALSRAAPIALAPRRDLAWLLGPREAGDEGLSAPAREVLAALREHGASFLEELAVTASTQVGGARTDVEDALWELVAAGRVTGDGFGGLRALLGRGQAPPVAANPARIGRWRRAAAPVAAGRWALLRAPAVAVPADGRVEAFARQYLRRYGIVFRDLLAREPQAPAWRDLLGVYRRLEMKGELRGGRLVTGFVGEQFALPEALDALRATRREPARGEVMRISACDPLNLVGVLTSGPRVPATMGNEVVYRDGVPVGPDEVASPDEVSTAGLAG
jgi:ATP-dependent Lhr-like helicase